jgi:MFS family permease
LTLTLMLMAFGSGMVALTPPYSRIGIVAPLLLLIARLIQGFSCGGEVGPATTLLLESAPPDKRAALTAWQGYSQQLASLAGAGGGVALAALLSREQLYAWGWRVPFLAGVLIAPVALYIRRQLPETIDVGATHESTTAVLRHLVRRHTSSVLYGVLIICGGTVSTYVANYMTTYAITTLHLSATLGTTMSMTGAAGAIAGIALGVWLDRFGRKTMLLASRIVFVLTVYPAYRLLTAADATVPEMIVINVLMNVVFSTGMGAAYAFLAEAFPRSVRSSGLAILYALGVMIFGGTTQFVVAWLIHVTGNPIVPAWYQMGANVVSIVGVALLHMDAEVLAEQRSAVGALAGSATAP